MKFKKNFSFIIILILLFTTVSSLFFAFIVLNENNNIKDIIMHFDKDAKVYYLQQELLN